MKWITLFALLISIQNCFSQDNKETSNSSRKGKLYLYFGWNRASFTHSDLEFTGSNYGFTLKDVVAKDRPSSFALDPYFNPGRFTIPQYNFRVGYFTSDHWSVSVGTDHMKYVMQQNQKVKINGEILDTVAHYEGIYNNEEIALTNDFLIFEHTDGLNYINVEIRRYDQLFRYKNFQIQLTEGFGTGVLVPRTNTTLLGKRRHDQFHISGFGLSTVVGLNFSFYDHFFIQSEVKGGYVNMPNVRTTSDKIDKAKQSFFFAEYNLVFGTTINLNKKSSK